MDGCRAEHHNQHQQWAQHGKTMDSLDPEDGLETSPENSKAKNLDKPAVRFTIPGMEKTASESWYSPRVKHYKYIPTERTASLLCTSIQIHSLWKCSASFDNMNKKKNVGTWTARKYALFQ